MSNPEPSGHRHGASVLVAPVASALNRARDRARFHVFIPDPGAWFASCIAQEAAHRRLFPWSAIAFGVGIILFFSAEGVPGPWPSLLGFTICLAIAVALAQNHRARNTVMAVAIVFAGFSAGAIRHQSVDAPIIERVTIGHVEGFVESIEQRERGVRVVIRVEKLEGVAPEWTPGRVRVTLRDPGQIVAGDYIRARTRLMPPPEAAWPGGYDFARGAYFLGIGAVGSVLGAAQIVDAPHAPGLAGRIGAAIDIARTATTERIASVIGGQAGAVAAALVTGKRGLIGEETNEALRAAGIYHIVSISGLHMVLAAGTIFWLTRAILALVPFFALTWPLKKIAAVAAILGALTYCIFSGAQVATVRAVIMTGVMLGAVLFDRPALSMRNLAIAALVVMAWQPETILGPSFQMSFSAVVGLIAGAEWLRMRGRTPRPPADMLGRGVRWVTTGMMGITTTTIIATIATGPFAAFHFQIANPYGLVGNGLALPIVSILVMPAAVIGMIAYPFGLDRPAWHVMGYAVDQVIAAAAWVESFAGSTVPVAAFGAGALGLMVVGLITGTLFISPLRRLSLIPAALGMLAATTPERPDIFVDRAGAGAAVRAADGNLVILGRPSAFVAEQWLKADGDWRLAGDPTLAASVRCDKLGCVADLGGGRHAAFVSDRRAFAEDCARAEIIVTPLGAPAHCRPELLVDRNLLRKHGAIAVRFTDDGPVVTGVRGEGETRPWLARNAALHEEARRDEQRGARTTERPDELENPGGPDDETLGAELAADGGY
jgi:competence protein ComEC